MNSLSTALSTLKMSDPQRSAVESEGKEMPPECGNTQRGLAATSNEKDHVTTSIQDSADRASQRVNS